MKPVLLATLLACVGSSAIAADLPSYGAPAAPAYYAPSFSWAGAYAGLNGGWAFGDLSNSNFANPYGGEIGAQVGYNMQMNQFVLGLEADLEGTGMVSTAQYPRGVNKFGTHALTTERVRAGFAMERLLFYATGGYAGVQTTASYTDTFAHTSGWASEWRSGGAIGAGVEYAVTPNIIVRGEYIYLPFSDTTYFARAPAAETSSLSLNILRAGVNYKF